MVPAIRPTTVHQQGLLAVLAHHPASEGSQDILVLRQLTFLRVLQDHVAAQHVGGALWESVDQFLISTSYQLLADLGLCLVQDAYGICVPVKVAGDHNVGSGLASSLCCGSDGVVAMPLLLLLAPWWWGWHCCCCCCCGPSLGLLLAARAVLVDFCCTGCCCHGECLLVNKGGPFVVFAATDLSTSSGPGGGPVGKCLRKVFIKKQDVV